MKGGHNDVDRSGQIMFRPNNYVLEDGEKCAYQNDAILADGERVRVPVTVMDHDTSGRAVTQDGEKRGWNGDALVQLRRPGFRPKTLLKDAATTEDVEAMDAAKSLNKAYDELHAKRARQAAEIKAMFDELQYQRR
jgi:hypothetical protein